MAKKTAGGDLETLVEFSTCDASSSGGGNYATVEKKRRGGEKKRGRPWARSLFRKKKTPLRGREPVKVLISKVCRYCEGTESPRGRGKKGFCALKAIYILGSR